MNTPPDDAMVSLRLTKDEAALLDAVRRRMQQGAHTSGTPLADLHSDVQMSLEDTAALLLESGLRRVVDEVVLGLCPYADRLPK